jgi:hypothetical protein
MEEFDKTDEAMQSDEHFHKFLQQDIQECIKIFRSEAVRLYENVFWHTSLKNQIRKDIDIRSIKVVETRYTTREAGGPSGNYPTSKLLLQGNWLRNKGFKIGGKVWVIALRNFILIVPEVITPNELNSITDETDKLEAGKKVE